MLLGVAIVVALLYQYVSSWHRLAVPIVADSALTLIGGGLAVSAVLELAYTFVTRGPDEALDPFILGASSFALTNISRGSPRLDLSHAIPLALVAIAIVLLFIARRFLLIAPAGNDPPNAAPQPDQPDPEKLIPKPMRSDEARPLQDNVEGS